MNRFIMKLCLVLLTFLTLGCRESQSHPLRIALLGDSMTWIGGDSCENAEGWSHYLKERVSDSAIDVYARSGATWTNTSNTKGDENFDTRVLHDENVLYNQVSRLLTAIKEEEARRPELVILYAGANDAWFENKRPDIYKKPTKIEITAECEPGECTTLEGSVMLCVSRLRAALPDARIVLVTPVEMSRTSPERIAKVSDLIEKAGIESGVEVLRADRHVDIRHSQEKKRHKFTSDGVHTNSQGARMIADYIITSIFETEK